jgi:muramidase (phage lysozyme)
MSVSNPVARQWLDLIAYAEGTDRARKGGGYDVLFGGGKFTDFSRHPDRVITTPTFPRGSAAAGRYQFMPGTYASVAKQLGLKDFSPSAQDKAALELIERRGVNPYVDKPTPQTVAKLAPEWASLPTIEGKSYYGQPVKSFQELQKFLGSTPSQAVPAGQPETSPTGTQTRPKFNFQEALKNVLENFAVKTLGPQSSEFTPEVQRYLAVASDIDAGDSSVLEDYENRALQSMLNDDGLATSAYGVLKDVLDLKRRESEYNQTAPTTETSTPLTQNAEELMSIVDLGKRLQEKGFRIGEHPAFGEVGQHAPKSHHYAGHALDITDWGEGDWKTRTKQLGAALKAAVPGAEVFHPGYDPVGGHHEHVHFAVPGGKVRVTEQLRKLLG